MQKPLLPKRLSRTWQVRRSTAGERRSMFDKVLCDVDVGGVLSSLSCSICKKGPSRTMLSVISSDPSEGPASAIGIELKDRKAQGRLNHISKYVLLASCESTTILAYLRIYLLYFSTACPSKEPFDSPDPLTTTALHTCRGRSRRKILFLLLVLLLPRKTAAPTPQAFNIRIQPRPTKFHDKRRILLL